MPLSILIDDILIEHDLTKSVIQNLLPNLDPEFSVSQWQAYIPNPKLLALLEQLRKEKDNDNDNI